MKSAIRPLGIITISLFGFLAIVSFYTDKSKLEYSGREMQEKALSTKYLLSEEEVHGLKNPQIVDIRDSKNYRLEHEDDALNIPLSVILDEEYKNFFESSDPKVILAYDPVKANEAWMLMTQLGYENLYVTNIKQPEPVEEPEEMKERTGPRKVISGGH